MRFSRLKCTLPRRLIDPLKCLIKNFLFMKNVSKCTGCYKHIQIRTKLDNQTENRA